MTRRWAALALFPLIGAAPAPIDITPAATCTLPRAETEAAFRALPLLATEDDTEADERGTIYTFREATLWGAPAHRIKLSDYADPKAGTATQSFAIIVEGDYPAARNRVLAASGKAKCDREFAVGDANTCDIALAPEGAWGKSVNLAQAEGLLMLTCTFTKKG